MVVWHLKQIRKVKKLSKWVPHELTTNKKTHWSVVFSYSMPQQWTISQLDCDVWWKVDFTGQWWLVAQWLDWEEAPEHFLKPNLHQKKAMDIVWWSAACLTHCSFLNPSEIWIPLQLRRRRTKLVSNQTRQRRLKSVRRTKNCNASSWSTERAQFFSMTLLNCTSQNQCFKSWMNWATKFCLIHHIHLSSYQPTTSTTLCRQKFSTSRRQKMLSKNWLNSEAHTFTLQE